MRRTPEQQADDNDFIFEQANKFREEYKKLVNNFVNNAPDHLKDELAADMQAKSSVYSVLE